MVGFLGLCRHFAAAKRKVKYEEKQDEEIEFLMPPKRQKLEEIETIDIDDFEVGQDDDELGQCEGGGKVEQDPLLIIESESEKSDAKSEKDEDFSSCFEIIENKDEKDLNSDFLAEIDSFLDDFNNTSNNNKIKNSSISPEKVILFEGHHNNKNKINNSHTSTSMKVINVLDSHVIDIEAPVLEHPNIFLQCLNNPKEKLLFPFREELDQDSEEEEDDDCSLEGGEVGGVGPHHHTTSSSSAEEEVCLSVVCGESRIDKQRKRRKNCINKRKKAPGIAAKCDILEVDEEEPQIITAVNATSNRDR